MSVPSPASTRELTRRYKESHPPMGVYVIRNVATGRVFVRASLNLDGAMNRDRFELGLKQHRHRVLMDEWLRYGAENFRFEVIDTIKKREDPAFDYQAELDAMLALWAEELST